MSNSPQPGIKCQIRSTSKYMILVPLIDLKFLKKLAAWFAGTSNRRHWCGQLLVNPLGAFLGPSEGLKAMANPLEHDVENLRVRIRCPECRTNFHERLHRV